MNSIVKRKIWFAATLLGWVMMASYAHAASFDCAKAQSKVEHMICDNSEISKLDDKLGQDYQDVLSKTGDEQKKQLISDQNHWLNHTRNTCRDKSCVELAYWARQAALETFFEPKSPLYKRESDKAEVIKQLLATEQFNLLGGTPAVPNFCTQLFDDLKRMNNIRFVAPAVQTLSYEDPKLDPWTKPCEGGAPLIFKAACFRSGMQSVLDTVHSYGDAMEALGCTKGFGLPPYRVYELPDFGAEGNKQYIFYADDNFGSSVWRYSDSFTPEQWERNRPRLGGGGMAGFWAFDVANCKSEDEFFMDAGQGRRNGKNYNSIIKYKSQYYFLVLHEQRYIASDGGASRWELDVSAVARNGSENDIACNLRSTLKPEIFNQGGR